MWWTSRRVHIRVPWTLPRIRCSQHILFVLVLLSTTQYFSMKYRILLTRHASWLNRLIVTLALPQLPPPPFNGPFPVAPRLAGLSQPPSVFVLHLFEKRTFQDKWHSCFTARMPFLSGCHPGSSVRLVKDTFLLLFTLIYVISRYLHEQDEAAV